MSVSFLGALAGTLAALAGAGLLSRLCARAPRMDLVAWTVALAGLALALAVQAIGYRSGFGPSTFRAAQLGAALIAPLGLCWGMIELLARSPAARFAARLGLGALFVVAAVIMATDVLSAQPFSVDWPSARTYYEFLPLGLLALVAVLVAGTALGALGTAGVRSGRDPRWRPALAAVGAASAAALATQGLLVRLPVRTGDVALCLAAVAATWLAGDRAARVQLGALRGARESSAPAQGAPAWGAAPAWAGNGAGPRGYAGDDSLDLYGDGYRGYGGTGGYPGSAGWPAVGGYAGSGGYPASGGYPGYGDSGTFAATGGYGDTGGFAATGGYGDTGGFGATGDYEDTGGFAATGGYGDTGDYPVRSAGAGSRESLASLPPEPVTGAFDALYRDRAPVPPGGAAANGNGAGPAGAAGTPESGIDFVTGMQLAALEDAVLTEEARERAAGNGQSAAAAGNGQSAPGDRDSDVATERLYGQIAIYTLLETGAAEFDRLSGQVLGQVRANEPGTLVYVVHAVPSAPLQRILYQVYRDRQAYDEHLRQPYMEDFESRLRPLVLATNVIELGVREAKVVTLRARSAARERSR